MGDELSGVMPCASSVPIGHVRVATLRAMPELIQSLGGDAAAVRRAARIDERLFENPDAVIPVSVRGRYLALAAAATGCDHLGLLIGSNVGAGDLGWPGRLMLASPTVGDALVALQQFWHLHNPSLVILLRRVGEEVEFGCAVLDASLPGMTVFEDAAMAVALNLMRQMLGREWAPSVVHLMRRPPGDSAVYAKHFSAHSLFNAPASVLRFPVDILRYSIGHVDPDRAASDLARLRIQATLSDTLDWIEHVRRQVFVLLLQGGCNQRALADILGTSSRTMNRRLAESGMSYQAMIETARFSISRRLMRETDMPLGDIARVLGYSEASSLTRAFRRWAGVAPETWRRTKANEGRMQ